MQYKPLLIGLFIGFLYPLWLVAGCIDYLCHRRTNIEKTSGIRECGFHLLQFTVLFVALVLSTLFATTALVLVLLIAAIAMHSMLAYADVAYTQPRRYISPLEQHVHGYMDVLPVVALSLLLLLSWHDIWAGSWRLQLRENPLELRNLLLLGSFAVIAGIPILEELWRAWKHDTPRKQ